MGVSSIREFAAPLMVGIICGAYSSVCITGALWLVMKKKIGAGQDTVKAAAAAAPAKKTAQSANTQSAPASNAQGSAEEEKPQESSGASCSTGSCKECRERVLPKKINKKMLRPEQVKTLSGLFFYIGVSRWKNGW